MAKQLVPDTAQFRVQYTYTPASGDIVRCFASWYVRNLIVPWNGTLLAAKATAIGNAFRDSVLTQMSDEYSISRVRYEDLSEDPGVSGEVTYAGTAGGIAGQASPCVVCFPVIVKCTPGGIPRRGRLFLSGIAEGDIEGNQISATRTAGLKTGLDAIEAAISVGSDVQVIVSRTSVTLVTEENPKGLRPVGITNDWSSNQVGAEVWVQRRRRESKG